MASCQLLVQERTLCMPRHHHPLVYTHKLGGLEVRVKGSQDVEDIMAQQNGWDGDCAFETCRSRASKWTQPLASKERTLQAKASPQIGLQQPRGVKQNEGSFFIHKVLTQCCSDGSTLEWLRWHEGQDKAPWSCIHRPEHLLIPLFAYIALSCEIFP